MKRALITGGTGFVGANLANRLVQDGCEVFLLLRPEANRWRLSDLSGHVTQVEADLRDREAVEARVAAIKPDWAFHLGVYGAYPGEADLEQMVHTNILGTINLVQACVKSGTEALVNAGSSSEYGFKSMPPSETDLLEPNSHYAWTKAAATHYCRQVATQCDVRLTTLRLYSVYGPYEEPGRLIPTLVARGLTGHLPPLVSPDIVRDFVYVDDVVSAFVLAAQSRTEEPGQVYNVGTGVQTTLKEAVDIAVRCMNISDTPVWGTMAERQWDSTTWVSDSSKIQAELGWRPRFTFEKGFALTAQWLRDRPELHERYGATGV